jgi:hypothetical protein
MDNHQARTISIQEEIKTMMDIHQEEMGAAMHSLHTEVEDNQMSGRRCPVMCRPKDAGRPQGTGEIEKHDQTYRP